MKTSKRQYRLRLACEYRHLSLLFAAWNFLQYRGLRLNERKSRLMTGIWSVALIGQRSNYIVPVIA